MSVLYRPVLILNRNWVPVGVKSVKKAFIKVSSGVAHFLDTSNYMLHDIETWVNLKADEDNYVSTVSLKVKVPEIIVSNEYDGYKVCDVKLNKKNLLIRDNYRCQYTGEILSYSTATVDHIVPRSRGGQSIWTNLVICSKDVNRRKADKTLQETGLKLLNDPVKPKWNVHYAYSVKSKPASWDKFLKIT